MTRGWRVIILTLALLCIGLGSYLIGMGIQ